jgi:hypothetical protein
MINLSACQVGKLAIGNSGGGIAQKGIKSEYIYLQGARKGQHLHFIP